MAEHRRFSFFVVFIALVVATTALTSCASDGRSVEAFCDAFDEGTGRLQANAESAMDQENAFLGLAQAFGGFGEMQQMLDEMASAAPDEIRAEAEIARDVFRESNDTDVPTDAAGALSSMFGAALTGMMNQPQLERFDAYTLRNCGGQVFGMA